MSDDVEQFDHVIVGGGMVSDAAARAIRDVDPNASIVVLGREPDPAVTRPALSKKLWTDPDFAFEQIWCNTAEIGAEVRTSSEVVAIDRAAARVRLADGSMIGYGRLLLATGGEPRRLELPNDHRIIYFRTVDDYRRLRELSGQGRHVVVVGGGYIGTEIACSLTGTDTAVTLVYAEPMISSTAFPAELAASVTREFADHGVDLRPGTTIVSGEAVATGLVLQTEAGDRIEADAVVVGLGIEPATGLASAAGLAVDDGVVVDEHLRTADPHVFAAGDVARYPDALLGSRRIEHVDNATVMGERVGRAMAGDVQPYTHTPMFYSVLFGTRYEAVGTLDSECETVERWNDDRSAGVVHYLADDADAAAPEVIGVLLWGLEDRTDDARAVISTSQRGDLSRDALAATIDPTA